MPLYIRYSVSFVLALLASFTAHAQLTEYFRNADLAYFEAKEWMQAGQYESARKGFEQYLAQNPNTQSELVVNATYYEAFCTMELFHKDAEFMMEEFVIAHPESNWNNPAIHNLADYNFNRRDYDDAIYWFNRLDVRDLKADEADEVTFKKGFSAFELEQYGLAKSEFYKLKEKQGVYFAPTNYYFGHLAYREGNYQTALVSLERAEKDENFAPVVPYYKTQILHYQDKFDELIAYATPLLATGETVREEEIAHLVGNAHYQKQEYAEAVPFLEKYMSRNYNPSPEDSYQLAFAYYRSGSFAKAIDSYAIATKAEDKALAQVATYQMADAYVKLDEKKFAQNAFKLASEIDEDQQVTEDALFNYAKLAYELSYDPFHEAIQAFERYLNKYPKSNRKDEAYDFLLKVHLATKNYTAAIDALNKLKSLDAVQRGQYQKAAFNLGVSETVKKDAAKAFSYFTLSKKYPEDAKLTALANYWAGELHYREGEYGKAVSAYQAYLSSSASFQTEYYNTANYNIGYAQFKQGEYPAALSSFRKYVSGANIDTRRKNDALLRIGDLYLVTKSYGSAIENYEAAAKGDHSNGDYALFQVAQAYGYQDQFKPKATALEKLLRDYPETTLAAAVQYELGDSYFMVNELDRSLGAFNTVITDYGQSPYRKKALLKRGLVQYRKSDYDGAIKSYKQVVADYGVDSESNEAVVTLKNIYLDLGKVDEYSKWLNEIPDYEVSPSEIDSLSYQAAENLVADGDCDKGIKAFQNYLKQYPNGLFVLDANYYLADCAYRQNNFDLALKGFEYVASKAASQYSEPALEGAAQIRFDRKEYEAALAHYKSLKGVATFASNILGASLGEMRAYYALGRYDEALAGADRVINDANITEDLLTEARMTKGRILFIQKNYAGATPVFTQLAKKANSKEGAEAKYRLAEIHFFKKDLAQAEKSIFELIEGFPNQDFWKVKGFLLLSDVYVERKDFFQARATLKSVIDNVKDADLVNTAKQKMAAIDKAETKAISAKDTLPGRDTLDYEDDYKKLINDKN